VYAVGIDWALRANRIAGVALLTSLIALFVLQQADWYRRLEPDREAERIIDCLERSGVRAAYADYWLSYKLTFLTGERVIVAPTNGVDRYPPYTAFVRAQPFPRLMIKRWPPGSIDAACRP
jgi:phosphosulfolactate phosphohydrolase-like enzyme